MVWSNLHYEIKSQKYQMYLHQLLKLRNIKSIYVLTVILLKAVKCATVGRLMTGSVHSLKVVA